MPNEPKLTTVGVIASESGYPFHRVVYVVNRYKVRPDALAGRVRLFKKETADQIVAFIQEIDGRKLRLRKD